jgi:hypothetical protein
LPVSHPTATQLVLLAQATPRKKAVPVMSSAPAAIPFVTDTSTPSEATLPTPTARQLVLDEHAAA